MQERLLRHDLDPSLIRLPTGIPERDAVLRDGLLRGRIRHCELRLTGAGVEVGDRITAVHKRMAGVIGAVVAAVLGEDGVSSAICASPAELYARVDEHALLLVITEEGLSACSGAELGACLRKQPVWSDLPVVALTGSKGAPSAGSRLAALAELGNVYATRWPRWPGTPPNWKGASRSASRIHPQTVHIAGNPGRHHAGPGMGLRERRARA